MTFLDLTALAYGIASDMGFTPFTILTLALSLRRDQPRQIPSDIRPSHCLDQTQQGGIDPARKDGVDDRS